MAGRAAKQLLRLAGPSIALVIAASNLSVPEGLAASAAPSLAAARASGQERKIVACINRERRRRAIPALQRSSSLSKAAHYHAKNMARYGFFDHTDPWGRGPEERVALFDSRDWAVGENIAAGYRSVSAACRGWMHSAGHRANILDSDYQYVGGGYARGGPYRKYYVADFGILYSEPTQNPPPEQHDVVLTLSNSDDTETIYLNGQEVGSVGYGEQQSFDLGNLSDSDQIYVEVYNADGGYTWSIDEQRDGTTVFHNEAGSVGQYGAKANDQDHTNQVVHWVSLDPFGNVVGSYTVGS